MTSGGSSHSFHIHYRGGQADAGMIEAGAFAESLLGTAKLYGMLAHYAELGLIPRRRNRLFEVYVKGSVLDKSVDQEIVLLALDYSALLASGLVSIVMNELWSFIKGQHTKTPPVEIELVKAIREMQQNQHETTQRHLDLLGTQGEHIKELEERLNEKASTIADTSLSQLESITKPIENGSCESIAQFSDKQMQLILLTQEDAKVIRKKAVRTGDVLKFRITDIQRLNRSTRNCSVRVHDEDWGIYGVIFGEIHDPVLSEPDNAYTRAFNLKLGGIVFAEAAFVAGFVKRLYIKDIRVDDVAVIDRE